MKKIVAATLLACNLCLSSAFGMSDQTHDLIRKVQRCRDKGNINRALKICEDFISNPYIPYAEKVHMIIVMSNLHWHLEDLFGMEMDCQLLKQIALIDSDARFVLHTEYEIDFN
jgi:hypothetical protein